MSFLLLGFEQCNPPTTERSSTFIYLLHRRDFALKLFLTGFCKFPSCIHHPFVRAEKKIMVSSICFCDVYVRGTFINPHRFPHSCSKAQLDLGGLAKVRCVARGEGGEKLRKVTAGRCLRDLVYTLGGGFKDFLCLLLVGGNDPIFKTIFFQMHLPKRKVVFQPSCFIGYVSFQGCKGWLKKHVLV